jgi:RNA polymerase sigma factor (sigma-70 family)
MMFEHSSDDVIDLERALEMLSLRDKYILTMFAYEYSQSEIGQAFGISQQAISKIIRKTVVKIASQLQ